MSEARLLENKKILVVDDHKNIRLSLKLTLEGEGAIVDECASFQDGLLKFKDVFSVADIPYCCILLDIRLPDGNGLDLLKEISKRDGGSKVIMISGEGTAAEAFKATQLGAFDYVEKPFAPERLLVSVSRCLKFQHLEGDNAVMKRELGDAHQVVGSSPKMRELHAIIQKVAPTQARVLIKGESGSGKELVASELHKQSPRRVKPFVKINCAAIPYSLMESELFGHVKGAFTGADKAHRGVFERAHEGSLFLDEIGELPLDVQAKLLRVLEEGEFTPLGGEKSIRVDTRLFAATHRDLAQMVKDSLFREDLYYRLNVVSVQVPSLRERVSDISELANIFLSEVIRENSLPQMYFSESALKKMESYDWPGNVRELKNFVEKIGILSHVREIDLEEAFPSRDEPPKVEAQISTPILDDSSFRFETPVVNWNAFHKSVDTLYLQFVLNACSQNVTATSKVLELERAYLHRLIKKLGIERA